MEKQHMDNQKPIHLLVDGDITYHRACRRKDENGDAVSLEEAVRYTDSSYRFLKRHLGGDKMTICLSGTSGDNFRKDLYLPYKGNREGTGRSSTLDEAKQYIIDNYACDLRDRLEADDILGILSTEPQDDEKRIIVSIDKDLYQIPGYLYNPMRQEEGVVFTDRPHADLRFYKQWLTGDSVDSYPGIPGVGEKRAEKLFAATKFAFNLAQSTSAEPVCWRSIIEGAILALYHDHQLTYDYAITQGRLARILRWSDYTDGEISLWTPRV